MVPSLNCVLTDISEVPKPILGKIHGRIVRNILMMSLVLVVHLVSKDKSHKPTRQQ